ncbi:MAG: hypothetical protein ABIE70_01185 [bacterium]
MKSVLFIALCGLVLLAAATAYPYGAPREFNYQGVLRDADGEPVTTQKNITFRIYNAETAGAVLWQETLVATPDNKGGVCLLLGRINSLADSVIATGDRWLAIQIEGDAEMTQRTKLVSSPYAMRVGSVDKAEAGVLHGLLQLEHSTEPSGESPQLCLVGAASDQVCLAPAGEGSVFAATSETGAEVFSMSVDTETPFFIARGPGGDETVISAASAAIYNGTKGIKIAEMSEAGIKLFSSTTGNALVELQETVDGAEVLVRQGTGGSEQQLSISEAGAVFMSNGGADTNCVISSGGNIVSRGQIAVGEGNFAGWMAKDGETWSVVFGFNNTASGDSSTVSGGYNNTAAARLSTIGGGTSNSIDAEASYSIIGGGAGNNVDSAIGTIGGGIDNYAGGYLSCVGGGGYNEARRWGSAVAGGSNNIVAGVSGTICGGLFNVVNGNYGAVLGGHRNEASSMSGILGGRTHYIDTSAGYSAILGGDSCRIWAEHSIASGWRAIAKHRDCFIWSGLTRGDNTDSVWTSQAEQVVLAAGNGIYLTNSPGEAVYDGTKFITTSTGASLTTDGIWTDAPKYRGDKQPVNGNTILGQLEGLPVYKLQGETDAATHVGPTAEGFYDAFGLGQDGESISALDVAGIALAAVQELHRKTVELEQLRARLDANEMILADLSAQLQVILAERGNASNEPSLAVNP